jgi:hypothetical protein
MQILLGFIAGAAIGIAIHFLVADRPSRGVAVAPMIGTVSAGLAWTILTWAGIGIDSPWPWLAAIVVPVAVTWPAVVLLSKVRAAHDERERARLKLA